MNNLPKNINWPLVMFAVFFLGPLFGKLLIPLLIAGGVVWGVKRLSILKKQNRVINIDNIINNNHHNMNTNNSDFNNTIDPILENLKKKFSFVVIVIIAVLVLAASVRVVDAGETGVYSLFGKVSHTELPSGLHLVNPFGKITPMTIRTEEYTMSVLQGEGKKAGADAIAALTKEGLNVDLDITVLYHLNQDDAAKIYDEIGLNYEEKLIRPEIRSAIRGVIAMYEAKDIYSEKRQEAAQNILEDLGGKLNGRGIIIEDVLLRNIQLPSGLAESIQQKLQAEQEAQRYDFILDKERKEKERKIIDAEGQKESQDIITKSLTTNYLYYLYINQLKDRAGTIYVPTSAETGMPLFREIGR
ncbi:prohibitin family protein [Patescibacteria group bacterium]|nr:prohibitin family protein [Patescibacteria group bacterium]